MGCNKYTHSAKSHLTHFTLPKFSLIKMAELSSISVLENSLSITNKNAKLKIAISSLIQALL